MVTYSSVKPEIDSARPRQVTSSSISGSASALLLWTYWLAGSLLASDRPILISDFDGVDPLARWTVSGDPDVAVSRGLSLGPGHTNRGAVLKYQFDCGRGSNCSGSVAAFWTPPKPIGVKRKAAISLWIRALPEVRLALLVKDTNEGLRRYPFEVTTLDNQALGDWRHVVIPLAAKSTGYWDENHSGRPEGRLSAIGIFAESRYPQPLQGALGFDELQLLESPDQTFALSAALPVAPAPPAAAHLRPRFGVNIHTLSDYSMLDLVRDAGFSFVRADLPWRQVERNGRYRFQFFDRFFSALEARHLGAIWILDYGHPRHGGDPPRNADDIAAFARYAEAAATHFKGGIARFEVWNEPNTDRFWKPQPNAGEFVRLLNEATVAIHHADPAAQVSSGGLARIDLPFLQGMIAAGWNREANAVAVHPYRRLPPETLAAELPLVRQMLARSGSASTEIWDTEWGYASYDYFSKNLRGDGHSEAGRMRQAVLGCREALTVWALGLPVAVWYDLRDDGDDPRNPEHNYGLLDARGADKPAMKALRVLSRIAEDHAYSGMVREVPDGVHAMRLEGKDNTIFAVWSEQPDSHVTVRLHADEIAFAQNLFGEQVKQRRNGHGEEEIALEETGGPVYIGFATKK